MNDTSRIRHLGIVESMDGDHVRVRISQSPACSSCKVAGRCNASGGRDKVIDVYDGSPVPLSRGDAVTVTVSGGNGRLAVVLSAVVPLAILLLALAVTMLATGDEALSGLVSLCALVPYYAALWLLRERLRQRLSFHIEPAGGAPGREPPEWPQEAGNDEITN